MGNKKARKILKMSTKFIEKFGMIYNKTVISDFSKGFSKEELDNFSDAHTEEHLISLMFLFPPPYLYEIYQYYKLKKLKC